MESVRVKIEGDADEGFKFVAVVPEVPQKVALYNSTKKKLWLMDYERALEVIDDYAERCMSAMMGKTNYIIIYPSDSAVKIDGQKYIMGEFLIMKSDVGVQCMTQGELKEAFTELASRMTSVYAGQYELPAYQVD